MQEGNGPQSSDPMDMLHGLSGLSLFSRTCRDFRNPPNSKSSDDLESIHDLMKSMALRSSNKHFEQAKVIVDENSELLNSSFASFLASEKENEAVVVTKVKENAKERRPALGSRRAKFTLKPNSSQPSLNLEPSLDIDQLQDPEEYFLACEKLENSRKELPRQRDGTMTDSDDCQKHFASCLASENENEVAVTEAKENAQDRRPALGRRRARFSLKPNSSQPSVNLEPSLDIDQLEDPEEYFLACEKLENAKKELLRQRGGSMTDLDESNISGTERPRRPGILGKSVRYKHRYSSMLPESDETFMSSQVTSGQDVLSPLTYASQPEAADPNVELQEKELTGSISKTENRVNGLLDELLSDKCENLDGNGVLSFLQEHLEIKPFDLDKLCLPDFHDFGKNSFMDLGENLPKSRNTFSDVQNFVQGTSGKTPVKDKQVVESPVLCLTSPTPPKSPFASISLLKKKILQSDLRKDPFSACDLSPARTSSVEPVDEQSDHHNKRKKFEVSGELKSLISEIGDVRVDAAVSKERITGDSSTLSEKSMDDNSGRLVEDINDMPIGSHGDLIDNNGYRNMAERFTGGNDSRLNTDTDVGTNGLNEMDDNGIRLNTDTDVLANGQSAMEDNVGDTLQEAVSSGDFNCGNSARPYTEFQTDGPNDMETNVIETNVEDMPQDASPNTNIGHPTTEDLDGNQSQQDQSSPVVELEPHAVDGPCETSDAVPEQHIENVQEPSMVSLNGRSPSKRPPRSKRNALRQSLAGDGTAWESGVRRSKRIKMRPLEYWKGERFLYGRIHQSLTTIIGVKYVSPGKSDGKPSMKVKSFVSDEYKELVELAALH